MRVNRRRAWCIARNVLLLQAQRRVELERRNVLPCQKKVVSGFLLVNLVIALIGVWLFWSSKWPVDCPNGASPPNLAHSVYQLKSASGTFLVVLSSAGRLLIAPRCADATFDKNGDVVDCIPSHKGWPKSWNGTYQMCEMEQDGVITDRCCVTTILIWFRPKRQHVCFDEYWTVRSGLTKAFVPYGGLANCTLELEHTSLRGGQLVFNFGKWTYLPPNNFFGMDQVVFKRNCGLLGSCSGLVHFQVLISSFDQPLCESLLFELAEQEGQTVWSADITRNDRNSKFVQNPAIFPVSAVMNSVGIVLIVFAAAIGASTATWHVWLFHVCHSSIVPLLLAIAAVLCAMVVCCMLFPATFDIPLDNWECRNSNVFGPLVPGILMVLTSFCVSCGSLVLLGGIYL